MKVGFTYKQKNKLLIAGAIIFTWIAYSVSFKETVALYQQCNELESRLQLASDAPRKIVEIEAKLADIRRFSDQGSASEISTQQKLLSVVTDYCRKNGVVLKEFPKTSNQEQTGLTIETNVFVVEGNFTKLLKLIYQLEQKNRLGQLASVEFQTKKDFKTQRIALTAKIFLQNIFNHSLKAN